MTDEEYLSCDDLGAFFEETTRRRDLGLPHAFDGVNFKSEIDTDPDCPF